MADEGKFTVDFDAERGLVVVTYHGLIRLEHRQQAVARGSQAMEEHGCRRVLVDFRDASMDSHSPEEESNFADVLSKNPVLAVSRIAYLARPGQSVNWFIEILAQARHFNCRHFTSIEEAHVWLAGGAGTAA